MSLTVHLFIHIFFAVLSCLVAWRLFRGNLLAALIFGMASGLGVDFDHFIDYFFAFGWQFDLEYFNRGYQFLKSDKIYVLLHGWEYVILFAILVKFARNKLSKTVMAALSLGLFFHLATDTVLNNIPARSYFISYRIYRKFDMQYLVPDDHYQKHLQKKKEVNL